MPPGEEKQWKFYRFKFDSMVFPGNFYFGYFFWKMMKFYFIVISLTLVNGITWALVFIFFSLLILVHFYIIFPARPKISMWFIKMINCNDYQCIICSCYDFIDILIHARKNVCMWGYMQLRAFCIYVRKMCTCGTNEF